MKSYLAAFIIAASLAACDNPFNRTISGDGNITTSERNASGFKNIRCAGSYDVELTQGSPSSVKIKTDENLQSYIVTDVGGNELNIHTKEGVNLHPSDKIKLYITTDKLEGFKLAGSGNVTTTNKLSGGDHLDLEISGSERPRNVGPFEQPIGFLNCRWRDWLAGLLSLFHDGPFELQRLG